MSDMYPFNINYTENPISFDSQSYQLMPLLNNTNNYTTINSEFDNFPSPSLFHFPSSPHQHEKDAVFELTWQQQLHDLFLHQTESNMENIKRVDDNNNKEQIEQDDDNQTTRNQQIKTAPRKRSSKKDRHSKITTASGLRDRRMRLSLPVARKFFGLQDMLGFDKASKTIEWLLTQSSSAIQKVSMKGSTTLACSSLSSTSECISGNIVESDYNEQPETVKNIGLKLQKINSTCSEKKKAMNARGKAFAKESRKSARERARKRTMEKKKLGGKIDSESLGDQYFGAAAAEESGNQNASKIISPLLPLQEDQYLSSLVISSNWNTSALCNFDQNEDISIQQQEYGSTLWY